MSLKPTDRVLVQLLRAAVESRNPTFERALCDSEWREVYAGAAKQGVLAVAWESVNRLPQVLQPGRELRLQWACGAEGIAARSKRQRAETECFAAWCAGAGCRLIVLKGIGLSRYYPSPFLRECGDVDIFLPEGFEKANVIAASCGMKVAGLDYKHNPIHSNGIVFENHRYLTSFKGKSDIRRLEKTLQEAIGRGEFLPFEDAGFYTLSPSINALYITYHSFFHFLIEGISLRHLVDWALFVREEQHAIDWAYFYRICDDMGFTRFANTMNAIAADLFGISLTNSKIVCDGRFADRILADVLAARRHVSGLPRHKRRLILFSNILSSRWKYKQLYGRSFLAEMARSAVGILFDPSPKLD